MPMAKVESLQHTVHPNLNIALVASTSGSSPREVTAEMFTNKAKSEDGALWVEAAT